MKAIKVKDLTKEEIVYAATKFFSKPFIGSYREAGFIVVNALYHQCGLEDAINGYRRAYEIERAIEGDDAETKFLRECVRDKFCEDFKTAADFLKSETDDYDQRAMLERFLENLVPDVYREHYNQTLID